MSLCPVCEQGSLSDFRVVKAQRYLRCDVCEATVMDASCRLSPEQEREIYQLHDNDPSHPGYRTFLSKLTEPLLERLPSGASGLDFGCGPGPALAQMLEAEGMAVSLYDPYFYPSAVALDQTYDFITCTEVVEHLYAPAGVFRELDRMLKPGGWLGVMTCFQTDDDRFDNWHYRRDPTHVVFYREFTFKLLANRFGWRLEIPRKDVALFRKPA